MISRFSSLSFNVPSKDRHANFLSALLVVLTQTIGAQTDVPGCTIEIACNYDPAATINDGTCDFTSCLVLGTDSMACNYDDSATINDGSCDYLSCLIPTGMHARECLQL